MLNTVSVIYYIYCFVNMETILQVLDETKFFVEHYHLDVFGEFDLLVFVGSLQLNCCMTASGKTQVSVCPFKIECYVQTKKRSTQG